jgi:hypothetical protein
MTRRRLARLSVAGSGSSEALPYKEYTVQLPLPLASQLEALCEMHTHKSADAILLDLIGLALAQVRHAATQASDSAAEIQPDQHQHVYLLQGPFTEFHGLIYKHHRALEKALDKGETELRVPVDSYALGDLD